MLKILPQYYLNKNFLIFFHLFSLYFLLKLQNFYPLFFFLIFAIEFYLNFKKKYEQKTFYKFKNRVFKFIDTNKYLIFLATFLSLIGFLKYITFDEAYKSNLIISDYLNIIFFFALVIFWKFIISEFVNLNVFSRSLYILLIIFLIDTLIDFYFKFSILKLSFNNQERPMSLFSTSTLGAYIYIIQILLINILFITNQNHSWRKIFLISYTIILFSANRIPLIFQVLTLIFFFLRDSNKNFEIKKNVIFFFSLILITIFFFFPFFSSKEKIYNAKPENKTLFSHNEFYDFKVQIKFQECRRINLLNSNIKLTFSSKNLIGVNNNEYAKFIHDEQLKVYCNEKIKHPHSLLFELIFLYGSIIFTFIIIPFFIIIFRPFKNINAMFFLLIIFFPSGLGSLNSFAWTSIISFVMAILTINRKLQNE